MITADLYFTADALDFLTNRNKNTDEIVRDAILTCEPFAESVADEMTARYPDKKDEILVKLFTDEELLKYSRYNIENAEIDETETREIHKTGRIGTTAFCLPVKFNDKLFMKELEDRA